MSFIQISAGGGGTCGIATDSLVYCWGQGTSADQLTPRVQSGTLKFAQLGMGSGHICGVAASGQGYCWGYNNWGQLGNGTLDPSTTPMEVAGNRRWRQIRAGFGYTCGVTTNRAAFCWGNNDFGMTGTNVWGSTVPLRVLGGLTWRQVVAGGSHTCGVTTDDRGYCWGNNDWGQLGDGTTTLRNKAVPVAGGLLFERVVPGSGWYSTATAQGAPDEAFTCGITTDAKGYCWGLNYVGLKLLAPAPVPGGRRWQVISPGSDQTCGVTMAHALFCWHPNAAPVRVASALVFATVSVPTIGSQVCALTTDKKAYCRAGTGPLVAVGPPA
ncbi:MAG: hypothetical protein ABIY46_12330 [Gemmatimonadales bacterium]